MREIIIVECSDKKVSGCAPALDLYVSERFVLARRVAEMRSDAWFVLSAKHGLIPPEKTVASYDLDLRTLSNDARRAWADRVLSQIRSLCRDDDLITLLCSDEYVEPLIAAGVLSSFKTRLPFRNSSKQQQIESLRSFTGETQRFNNLETFYDLLLNSGLPLYYGKDFGTRLFSNCAPRKGVYFFFEPSQHRFMNPASPRVVRVGTHGVSSGSKTSLLDRIGTHFGTLSGSGNHRSSVMRLHIGAAMLASGQLGSNVATWGGKVKPVGEAQSLEMELEERVSAFLRQMTVAYLSICDESSPKSDRAYIEQNSIALLAGLSGPLDPPDSKWLGSFSPKPEIRASGLWNVDFVHNSYDSEFLAVLDRYVQITKGKEPLQTTSLAPDSWYARRRGRETAGQVRLF